MAGCCGGRGKPRPRAKAPKLPKGRQVFAEYLGDRPLFSIRGPASGEKVFFAATEEDCCQVVWSGDLECMEKAGVVYAGELPTASPEVEDAENQDEGDPA